MPKFGSLRTRTKFLKIIVSRSIRCRNLSFDIDTHFSDSGYKLHLLDEGPSRTVELTKENGLKYYQQMHKIRKVEGACADLYRRKICRGFCHLYVGQEAIAVGVNSIMRPQDTVITTYRCHGWAVLKCESLSAIFSELMGNSGGTSRGKAGSIHLYGPNFYGGNGIVGANVPIGVGIALRHKYEKTDAINIIVFGDGAFNQGQVFEAFNFAKLQMLPIIFIVENNHYSMGTSANRGSATAECYKGCTFLPGIQANGNEILSVVGATKFAFQHINDGKGPIILEFMTYRYLGHSMSDPGTTYRDRDEIKLVRDQKDALKHLKKLILDSELGTEEDVKKIESDNKKKIKQALKIAFKNKPPPLEELTSDAYKNWSEKIRMPKMITYVNHKNIAKYDEHMHTLS